MPDFRRTPEGFRFAFGGLNTRSAADALPPTKYRLAQNLRPTADNSLRGRPGFPTLAHTPSSEYLTDVRAYVGLTPSAPNGIPRLLARSRDDKMWLDDGAGALTQVGSLASSGSGLSASLLPFRPNESIEPWMYVASAADYQKFSAPTPGSTAVTQQKVGIAEPQVAVEACQLSFNFTEFTSDAAAWTTGGTAGTLADVTDVTDTVVGFTYPDPAAFTTTDNKRRTSIPVSATQQYRIGQVLDFVASAMASGTIADVQFLHEVPSDPGYIIITLTGAVPFDAGQVVHFSGLIGFTELNGQSVMVINPAFGANQFSAQFTWSGGTAYGPAADTGTVDTGDAISFSSVVEDVYPPLSPTVAITVAAIYYFGGNSGRCVITPSQFATAPGELSAIRRGALIKIGTETVLVLGTIAGADGSTAIETFTYQTHVAGENLTGVAAVACDWNIGATLPVAVTSASISSAIGAGEGDFGRQPSTNPFTTLFTSYPFLTTPKALPQQDDYLHFSLKLDDPTQLTEMRFVIRLGLANTDYYYYSVRPSDITLAVTGDQTQLDALQLAAQRAALVALEADATASGVPTPSTEADPGANSWSEILFPITDLTRVGDDQTLSLNDATGIEFRFYTLGTLNIQVGSLWVGGGGQPDAGDTNQEYRYRVVPRNSVTGVKGNASPPPRYGVRPRRNQVHLVLPPSTYDSQIDTWDIMRWGGTVPEWRRLASVSSLGSSDYFDNLFDDAVGASELMEEDNFEPWPTIDQPFNGSASFMGSVATLVFASSNPARWLPGTLVQLAAGSVFTLWARPVSLGGNTWLLQFYESAGPNYAGTQAIHIQEPILGNQPLSVLWGPSDNGGVVFACGDPYRPGNLYFAKKFAPDSAPDTNNIEVTNPSEPLMGGELLEGLPFVASSEHWWRMVPHSSDPNKWEAVKEPVARGLAARWGRCSDGADIFFWAKDGIWSLRKGSLTDADLYNLFPHDGTASAANVVRNGVTIHAPDYRSTDSFRLARTGNYLYADYLDAGGTPRTLVLDLPTGAWTVDAYSKLVTAHYAVEQPPPGAGASLYPQLVAATSDGYLGVETDLANDFAGDAIAALAATFEWDGGDARASKAWADALVDLTPVAAVTVTPVSHGALLVGGAAMTVPAGASRVQAMISTITSPPSLTPFLGLVASWSDDYSTQTAPTTLYLWNPGWWAPAPEIAQAWQTQPTTHGFGGFGHIERLVAVYAATTDVTLAITAFDGTSPATLTLPSTGGLQQKIVLRPTANKGLMFTYKATASAPFQLWRGETVAWVKEWGSQGGYLNYPIFKEAD